MEEASNDATRRSPTRSPRIWTTEEIRDLCWEKFQKRPCLLQVDVAKSLREGKDVVACARTGAGKTLSFWLALLMFLDEGRGGMVFVVSPLNILSEQTSRILTEAGIASVAVTAKNATAKTIKDIEKSVYSVITLSPELLMLHPEVQNLWHKPAVTKKIRYFVFDEGHCISEWSSFRGQYAKLGDLRFLIPETIPFYVATATLPALTLADIEKTLHLRQANTKYILQSNNRPDIGLMVRGMSFAANSFKDLDFLVPDNYKETDAPLPRFVVFFDSISDAEQATKHVRERLPSGVRRKITWFHATMSPQFREDQLEDLKTGAKWGIFATIAFGMGMDLTGIKLVVQWKAPSDLSTLWQRFGRAARGPGETALAVLIVQRADLEETAIMKEAKAAKKKEKEANKRKIPPTVAQPPPKRQALASHNTDNSRVPSPLALALLGPPPDDTDSESGSDADADGETDEEYAQVVDEPGVSAVPRALVDLEERRAHYKKDRARVASSKVVVRKRGDAEEGTAMYDFINAKRFGCRRVVPGLYFGNDKDSGTDYLKCDTTTVNGCSRCKPPPTTICCDLCNPMSFAHLQVPADKISSNSGTGKSKLKPSTASPSLTSKLEKSLLSWRDQAALDTYGENMVTYCGSELLMSDSIIQRLIDCAEARKIKTHQDLARETGWAVDRAQTHGERIIACLTAVFPHSPPPAPKPAGPAKRRAPATRTCSKCGSTTHISSKRDCPVNVAERERRQNLENLAPQSNQPR